MIKLNFHYISALKLQRHIHLTFKNTKQKIALKIVCLYNCRVFTNVFYNLRMFLKVLMKHKVKIFKCKIASFKRLNFS